MEKVICGFALGVVITLFSFSSVDWSADIAAKRMDMGNKLCESHSGFAAFDYWGNFTCKGGLVLKQE